MLDYGFQVGEEVIDTYGVKGKIVRVCKCEECEKRGFYEPSIEFENSNGEYMPSNLAEQNGFPNIHSIGDRIFNDYDLNGALKEIERLETKMKNLQKEISCLEKGIERIIKESKNAN